MSDKLKVLVLNSSEAILGEVVEEDEKSITLTNILQIARGPQGNMLLDYMPFVENDTFRFERDNLRHDPMNPIIDLRNTWSQKYGSGLQIVNVGSQGPVSRGPQGPVGPKGSF